VTDEVKPGDNRLKGIDPEKLLVIEVDEIHPLLDTQYPELVKRGDELLEKAVEWATKHKREIGIVILDDAEMNHASDLYAQLRTYAGETGEVEETRKKVKLRPYQATQSIDAWFKTRRERLVGAMAVIDRAQNARADKVRADEQAERLRIAREAELLAEKLKEEARQADAPDVAVDMAIEAEDIAEQAKVAAAAPAADLTRTRSTLGVTTSQSEKWDYRVTDIKKLCAAVVAGTAPETFVMPVDAAIKLAIKGPKGKREIPGLEIYPDYKINRRGAK
jgi:hypothetical protein